MIDVGPIPILEATGNEIGYPIVRDMDMFMYERQTAGSMEVGSYAHRPIFHRADDIPSIQESRLSPTELPFTADDFDPQLEEALELMPDILSTAEIKYAINGLLSLTPDGFPLLGETPEVRNLWSAAAVWIKEGPGVGRMLAEWMTHGGPRDRSPPVRHRPLLPVRPQRPPRAGPLRRALQQDLRHRAPPGAVGVGAQPALRAVPRTHGGARRRLLPGRRLGAPALVRVERAARRAVRGRGPAARVGRPLVVADHERRAPGDAGARRHGRPRPVRRLRRQPARGRSTTCRASPSTTATSPSDAPSTRRCSTSTAASAPTSRSCGWARRRSGSSPARSTAPVTSTGSAPTSPTTARSASSTAPRRSCTIGVWGPRARDS